MRTFSSVIGVLMLGCTAQPVVETAPPKPLPIWQQTRVLATVREPGDDPAVICPENTRVYLRVDRLADWRDQRDVDPLVEHVWQAIDALKPPAIWEKAMDRLGLDEGAMADAMFGQCAVLVVHRHKGREAPFVLTRISRGLGKRLPQAFGMSPWQAQPKLGPLRVFTASNDDKALTMMIGRRWLVMGELRRIDLMRHWLCSVAAGATAIDQSQHARALTAGLPAQRDVLLLASTARDRHAAAVVRQHRGVTVHYAADSSQLLRIDKEHATIDGVNFGPLPADTVGALSINVLKQDQEIPRMLELLIFPHRFKRHVLGRLAPPVVAFLGSVPGHRIQPDPGAAVPALGVALHMSDRRVARDLDRLVVGVHRLVNLGELDLLRMVFGVRRIRDKGEPYHVANFGDAVMKHVKGSPLADLLQMPSNAGLTHLTFGPVGDWYVVCSQEAMFLDCRAAIEEESARISPLQVLDAGAPPNLLASGFTRVGKLAPMLNDAADFWQLSGLGKSRSRYDAPMRWLAKGLQHRQSVTMRLWREGPTRLRGRLQVTGNPAPKPAPSRGEGAPPSASCAPAFPSSSGLGYAPVSGGCDGR